jgi:hypothetical protein
MWEFFLGAAHGQKRDPRQRLEPLLVQPIEEARRATATPIEAQIVAVLNRAGALSYEKLVHRVTDELYQMELRCGAAVLDIGILGSNLFERDVVETIRAGNGVMWEVV